MSYNGVELPNMKVRQRIAKALDYLRACLPDDEGIPDPFAGESTINGDE